MSQTRRLQLMTAAALALVFALALPFAGPARTNPQADGDMALERQGHVPPDMAGLLRRACYDCHSHETRWPWYSRVAPVAWLVIRDVDTAREHMNFSTWGRYHRLERADLLDRSCELVTRGDMPLRSYVWMHPSARVRASEVEALCAWTAAESERLAQGPQ